MGNKDVLKISFDANAGIKELEKNLLSSMDGISDEVSDKLEEAFKKAGRNPKLKKQLTGVYQGLFDDLSLASGDIDKINESIDRFAGKIKYLDDVINKTSSVNGKKNKGLLDNLNIEDIDKILKGYEKIAEKEQEISRIEDKNFRDKKRSNTSIKSLKELERTYGDAGKAKEKYENKVNDYLKNAKIETSTISKEIKEYSSLIALFEKISNTKVDYDSDEAIKKSQALLYVMQKISDLENGNTLFKNFRINELDIDGVKSSLAVLSQQVEASITSVIDKIKKDLDKQISSILEDAVKKAEKMSQHQFKTDVKTQEKITNKNGKGSVKEKSNTDTNEDNLPDFDNNPDGIDVWVKSAQELEEEFKDVIKYATDVETSLKRINEIWDKYANGKGTLYKGEIEEMFTLMKRLDSLEQNGVIEQTPLNKEQQEEYNDVLFDESYDKVFERIDELTDRQLKKIEELKAESKDVFTGDKIGGTGGVDDSKVEELHKEIAEVKEDIVSLKDRVNTLEDTTAFDNLSGQVSNLDEKLQQTTGSVSELVNSIRQISDSSLSNIQKVTNLLFGDINKVFKSKNGNQISGYWEDLKQEVEGSNTELRELLQLVGLYNSKSNSLNLISDGMENSGGIIGDNKVVIARKNKGNKFEEKSALKQKLDEAYNAGINVARILDIIGTKESKVFLDVQEKASGQILSNPYGQNETDFINTDWFEATDDQIKKLISDLITLQKMGINVESNLTNIMYDKEKGFSFIDMDLDVTQYENNAELMQEHIMRIFSGLEEYYEDRQDEANLAIVEKARERFENLSTQVQQAYAQAQDSHSPSKEFEKLENDAVDGIVEGANKNEDRLKNVGKKMADNVKDGFEEGVSEIDTEILSSGVNNTQPIIENQQQLQEEVKETINVFETLEKVSHDALSKDFSTSNKTQAFEQLKESASEFYKYWESSDEHDRFTGRFSEEGTKAAYNFYKSLEEALRKEVAQGRIEKAIAPFNDEPSKVAYDLIEDYNYSLKWGTSSELDEYIDRYEERLDKFATVNNDVLKKSNGLDISSHVKNDVKAFIDNLEANISRVDGAIDETLDVQDIKWYFDYLQQGIKNAIDEVESLKNIAEAEDFWKFKDSIYPNFDDYSFDDYSKLTDILSDLWDQVSKGVLTSVEAQEKYNEELSKTLTYEQKFKQEYESKRGQISVLSSPTQEFDNDMQQNLVYLENYKNTMQEIEALKLQPETDETKKKLEELNKLADYFVSRITVIRNENNDHVSPEMMVNGYSWNERLKKYPHDKATELRQIARDKQGLLKNSYSEFSGISEEISRIESKSENLRQSLTKTMQDSTKFVGSIKHHFITLIDSQAELKEPYNSESDIKAYNKDIDDALEKFPQLIQFKDKFTTYDSAVQFTKTDEWNDFLATLPQAKAYLESIGYEFKEIAQVETGKTEILSGDNTNVLKTKEEVQEVNQEVDKIGSNFKEEESQVSSSISSEISMLQNLDQKLGEVTTAVDTKTRAFQEEEQVVVGTVQREISTLEALEGQIWSIINELKRLDDIKIQINLDGSQIDDSFVTLLDSIKTKADNLPVDVLSNLATVLQGLKVTGKTAENLEMVAIALSEFKDSLSGIAPEGNEFLKLIGDITSRTSELKDLAEVLKSTSKKIQEASEATKKVEDKPKDTESKNNSEKKNKNYDAKKNQAAIEETTASMERLKHLSDSDIFSNAFAEASAKIEEANTELKVGNDSLTEYKKKVKEIQVELQKKAGAFKFIEPGDVENAKVVMDAYARQASGNKATVKSDYTSKDQKKHITNYEWVEEETGLVRNLTLTYDKLNGALYENSKAHKQAEKSGFKFTEMLKQGWMNVAKYVSSFVGFYEVINAFRKGITVVRELDAALTEMIKVSDESAKSLKNFQKVTFDIGNEIGATAAQIQNSAADFMRLGYSLQEASKLAEDANIYANVGDMEIDEATEHMISSIKAWQSEFSSEIAASEAIIDRYNEIGNNFAISSADIGSAMERSAAALKAGGNTLNESLGLIVSGNIIQQDAETTAAALKIMSLRIRGSKAELDEMGESTDGLASSTSKLRDEIKALTGVDIMLDENTYKSTAQIIQEIGASWDKLTDVSQAAVLEKLAGEQNCLKFVETHIYRTHLNARIA